MFRVWPVLLGALVFPLGLSAREPISSDGADLARFSEVEAAPVKTSIYLGSVSLEAGRFIRRGQTYAADYDARVFPYFFFNETGRLVIDVPDACLRQLERGTAFDFKGHAVRSDGRTRILTGRVTPIDSVSGKLKIRLIVNRHLTLVFNSTYRLLTSAPVN